MAKPPTTDPEPRYHEVNCFQAWNYGWYRLPYPMTRRQADAWAHQHLGMPPEGYR